MGDIRLEEMDEEISNRILFSIRKAGLKADSIDFSELVNRKVGALQQPAISISINTGNFQKVTLTTYKKINMVGIYLIVSNLRGEEARRFAVYQLLIGIVKILLLNKLELPLQDPLKPVSFAQVTDDKFMSAGLIIYELTMSCSYNIDFEAEEDLGDLESIYNYYFLQDPVDDGVSDTEGIVELYGVRGGNAYSVYRLPETYGGRAATKYEEAPVYGGKAGSTY